MKLYSCPQITHLSPRMCLHALLMQVCKSKSLFFLYEKCSENSKGCPIFLRLRWTFHCMCSYTKDGLPSPVTQLSGLWNARKNIPNRTKNISAINKTKQSHQQMIHITPLTTKRLCAQVGLLQSCHLSPLARLVRGSSVILPLWSAAELFVFGTQTRGTVTFWQQASSQSLPAPSSQQRNWLPQVKIKNICKWIYVQTLN